MSLGVSIERAKLQRRAEYLKRARKLGVEEEVRKLLNAEQYTLASETLDRAERRKR